MSELIQKQKADLRSRLLLQRRALSPQDNALLSTKICEHLATYISLRRFTRILTFVPFRNELDVFNSLIQRILNPQVYFYLPRIDPTLRQMNFHLFSPHVDILVKNSFGIEEPSADQETFDETKNALSLILVPALALDVDGARLGYGGGYYDRFLAKVADIKNIENLGVISDAFILPVLPRSSYDISLQAYVSESGISNFPGQSLSETI